MSWIEDIIRNPSGALPPHCYIKDGIWFKKCTTCEAHKPIETDFYFKRNGGVEFECKACLRIRIAKNKNHGTQKRSNASHG